MQTTALLLPACVGLILSLSHAAKVGGELKQWHRVTVDMDGPDANEAGDPNPFLDYRLQVEFTGPAGQKYSVPGFFAADGNAGETGANSGKVWRTYFAPDQAGKWTYKVSFRSGSKVAISGSSTAGASATGDGDSGEFTAEVTDKAGRDFRGKGMLRYVNGHHLQFAGTKEYFLKAGSDSPENLLGYADFDGTSKQGGSLKTWEPHVRDWKAGDPTWRGGKGKGLIGALNYLAGMGMNAFSFLTFNSTGDGKDVWPWTGSSAFDRYDGSKLDQWEVVFSHADKLGLHLHLKTQETEVDQLLDGGNLGDNRKLYYRELIARFGHHLALNWNLGEENTQTIQQVKDCAAFFHDQDPYGHPIVLHTYPGDHAKYYDPLKGSASWLTGTSIQTDWDNVYASTRKWREASAATGRKWVIANDEQGGSGQGVTADAGYAGNRGSESDNREGIRKQTLWGNIMAGGAGVEYYFGYGTGETDLTAQDFRSRESKWNDARIALGFFRNNGIPFWEMSLSGASSAGWALAKAGEHYVVYLPSGGSPELDLAGATGRFKASWFNPRMGAWEKEGSLTGGIKVSLGTAPSSEDWVVWVRKDAATGLRKDRGRFSGPRTGSGPKVLSDGKRLGGNGRSGNAWWIAITDDVLSGRVH